MSRSTGTQKQSKQIQSEQTRQMLKTALGKLLLLKTGIAKGDDGKPVEVSIDAASKAVITSALQDISKAIQILEAQSQDKAKAKP